MRNIKYKAFDKKNKQMMDVKKIDFAYDDDGNLDEGMTFIHFTDGSFTTLKWVNLREFSGAKDWNQKEIFDGDICSRDSEIYQVQWTNQSYGDKFGWGLIDKNNKEYPYHYGTTLSDFVRCEIVGNIYQHPHLIKQD